MAFKLFKKKTKRACVIGLDGTPHSMLQNLMEQGVMPNARRITQGGTLKSMTVSLPEISSVSWSSFMTGKNPGEHGIFGFTDLKPNSYDLRFPMFRDLKTETIWDRLGRAGMRSIVINQPSTYPAREIPGVLISGFVSIDIDKSLYPRKYLASLARIGYEVDIDAQKCKNDPVRLFRDLKTFLDCRRAIMDELWDKEPWNLMEVVITGTDRLHHFLWDAYDDPDHAHHTDFLDYYRHVDEFIGHVYDRFTRDSDDDGNNFFMLSDHGFCGTRHEVYINAILAEHGYLSLEDGADDLPGIDPASRAFALDPARIYVHRRGRYPKGGVDAGDVETLKTEITELLQTLVDPQDGTPIVRRVFDGAEVYRGDFTPTGPDLLVIPTNGYDFKGRLTADTIVGDRRLQGMHTWDDAFFYAHPAGLVSADEELTIFDVPGRILRSLDVAF